MLRECLSGSINNITVYNRLKNKVRKRACLTTNKHRTFSALRVETNKLPIFTIATRSSMQKPTCLFLSKRNLPKINVSKFFVSTKRYRGVFFSYTFSLGQVGFLWVNN